MLLNVSPQTAAPVGSPRTIALAKVERFTNDQRIRATEGALAALASGCVASPIDDVVAPGRPRHRQDVGLGKAIVDFVHWLDHSGRLAAGSGSPWWRSINGSMIVDMDEAVGLLASDGPAARSDRSAVNSWLRYAATARNVDIPRAQRQEDLWEAHQQSVHDAVHGSVQLHLRESPKEQAFISQTIRNLDVIALSNFPSDNHLGANVAFRAFLRTGFPGSYPISWAKSRFNMLVRADMFPASFFLGSYGNIGLESTRWM